MIKNELLKSVLTETVFRVFSIINRVVPKDDRLILLYTNMGFRDNIKAIYDYLVENGYNQQYKILVSSNESVIDELPNNVRVINNMSGVKS